MKNMEKTIDQFWQEAFLALLKHGLGVNYAAQSADAAVIEYKKRFSPQEAPVKKNFYHKMDE